MFVTNLPARIVETKYKEIASGSVLAVGNEGLGTRMKIHADGVILTSAEQKDKTAGYKLTSGEVIEFSGCVDLYNRDSEKSVGVSVITTDSV